MDLLICAFFSLWEGSLSGFDFFDAKLTGKPHDITIDHIKHARQCVFRCLKRLLPNFRRFA
jgi:hypothetical protein